MKHYLSAILVALLFTATSASAQNNSEAARLIAESQSDRSSHSFFEIDADQAKDLDLDGFSSPTEFNIRGGAPNFMRKCEANQSVRVAYIGGSITAATDQYRTQSANFIATLYPDVEMLGIGAGIGGTGADLGAARLQDQVLEYSPDLLFVEFAVNGANEFGVEGIVRQTIANNPTTDICFIYTIYQEQRKEYARGEIPFNVKRLERVAEHYNLPSIHMGMWAGILETEGKLMWKADDKRGENTISDPVIFSRDGVHANEAGGDLYATAIARAFTAMKSERKNMDSEELHSQHPHQLIEPLHDRQMDRAKLIYPSELALKKLGWDEIDCSDDKRFNRFKDWYPTLSVGDAECGAIKFTFEGDLMGYHNIGGPFGCDLDIFIDGKKLITTKQDAFSRMLQYELVDPESTNEPSLICFNKFCGQIRNQYDVIKLDEGIHQIEIRVNDQPIDKAAVMGKPATKLTKSFKEQSLYLGAIIINGDIITK